MFLERYQLSEAETTALAADELDDGFFAALARVREIHDRCKVLLRTREQVSPLNVSRCNCTTRRLTPSVAPPLMQLESRARPFEVSHHPSSHT